MAGFAGGLLSELELVAIAPGKTSIPQAELTFKLPVDRLPMKSTPIALAPMSDARIGKMIGKH